MSRTRLIASLTAIACCLAVIATLAVWTFPLKAAPRFIQETPQSGTTQGVSGGVNGGAAGGIIEGVPGGEPGGVTAGIKGGKIGATIGTVSGNPTKITILSGQPSAVPAPQPQQIAQPTAKCIVGEIKLVGDVRDVEATEARILKVAEPHPCNSSNFDWLDELSEMAVRGDFQNHGYFEVAVAANPAEQRFDPATGLMHVTAHVTAGDQFRTGEIFIVSDNPQRTLAIPGDELRQQIHLQTGDLFNTDEVRQGVGRIIQLYRAQGYPDMMQKPEFFIDRANHVIVSTFHVHEGTKGGASAAANLQDSGTDPKAIPAGQNGVSMPTCKYCPKPGYSEEARTAKLSGTVVLQVTILADGHVGEIKLIKGIGKGLDEQAIGVVKNEWTFKPAIGPDGKEIAATVPIEILFQIAPDNYGANVPSCLYCPKPEYSAKAKKAHLEGTVALEVTVLPSGRAGEINLKKSLGMGLDEQAIEIIKKKWIFKPALGPNGKPVATIVPIEVNFQLY